MSLYYVLILYCRLYAYGTGVISEIHPLAAFLDNGIRAGKQAHGTEVCAGNGTPVSRYLSDNELVEGSATKLKFFLRQEPGKIPSDSNDN